MTFGISLVTSGGNAILSNDGTANGLSLSALEQKQSNV